MQIQATTPSAASQQFMLLDKERLDYLIEQTKPLQRITLAFSAGIAASCTAFLALGKSFVAPEPSFDFPSTSPTVSPRPYNPLPPRYVPTPSPRPAITSPIPIALPSSKEPPFFLESLYKIGGVALFFIVITACFLRRNRENPQPVTVSINSSNNNDPLPSLPAPPIDDAPKDKEPEDASEDANGSFVFVEEMSNDSNSRASTPDLSVLSTPSGASRYLSYLTPAAKWTYSTSTYALGSVGAAAWSYYSGDTTKRDAVPTSSRSDLRSGPAESLPRDDQALGEVKSPLQIALEHQESALETILVDQGTSVHRLLAFLLELLSSQQTELQRSLYSNLQKAILILRDPKKNQDIQSHYNDYRNHLRLASDAYQKLKKINPQNLSTYPNHLIPDLCKHWFEHSMTLHKRTAFDELILPLRGISLKQLNLCKETIATNISGWNLFLQQQSNAKTWQESFTTLFGYRNSPSDCILPEKYAVRVFNQTEVSFIRHGNIAVTPEYLCYLDSLENSRSSILYVNHDSTHSAALDDLENKQRLFHSLSLPINDHVINLKKSWLNTLATSVMERAANYNQWTQLISKQLITNQSPDLPEWTKLLIFALAEEREGFHLPQFLKDQVQRNQETLFNTFSSIAREVLNRYFNKETDWSKTSNRNQFLMIFYSYVKEYLQKFSNSKTVAVASDDELGDVIAAIDIALYNLRLTNENVPDALFHVCIQALTPALLHRQSAISEQKLNLLLGVLEKINPLNNEQKKEIRAFHIDENYQIERQLIHHESEIDPTKTYESFQLIGTDPSIFDFDPILCRPIDWSKIKNSQILHEVIKRAPPLHVNDFIIDLTSKKDHAVHNGRSCNACTKFMKALEETKSHIAQKICETVHRKLACSDDWTIDYLPESVVITNVVSTPPSDLQANIYFSPLFTMPSGERVEGFSLHAVITPTRTTLKLALSAPDAGGSQSN